MLRTEDKIRRLCLELLAATDDEEVRPILVKLRDALHQHIERLRERFASYPVFIERRSENKIPQTNEQPEEDSGNQLNKVA
jgi:nitrate reductase assembly molybdenum cofactor insertion protein NarJ